jgi:hypothetical protein
MPLYQTAGDREKLACRSPNLTQSDFFLRGYIPEMPLVQLDIDDSAFRITASIERTGRNMSGEVQDELDPRLYSCQVTNAAHIMFRVCKTFRVWHSTGTKYNCIALITLV